MISALLGLALLAAPVKHSATLHWMWARGQKDPAQGFYVMRAGFFHHIDESQPCRLQHGITSIPQ